MYIIWVKIFSDCRNWFHKDYKSLKSWKSKKNDFLKNQGCENFYEYKTNFEVKYL
jgi:hypothetical protein